MKKTLSAAWPALLLASLILLPWLNKAHTTDDTTFLLMSEHVLKDPLHPAAFEMLADGNRIRLSSQLVSGPVMAYLLVPSVLLGGAEWAAHLVQYLLMIAAILATGSLAFRLGLDHRGARLAGLLLASTPAVMAMATTSMADVPAMAFGVLGMEQYVAWRQGLRWTHGLAASLCFALAALSRPHLILLLAVAFALECGRLLPGAPASRRPGSPETASSLRTKDSSPASGPPASNTGKGSRLRLLPVFAAVVFILLVTFLTADPTRSGSHFMAASISRFHPVNAASNMAAFFLHWILVFPLGFLWLSLGVRWRKVWSNPAPWLAALVTLLIWFLDRGVHRVPEYALALAFGGALVILDIAVDAYQRRDFVQAFLWCWLLIALPAVAYVQLPCRYLLGAAPGAAILLAFLIRRSGRITVVKWAVVSAGVALALLIIAADAEFAAFGRRIAAEQIAPRVAKGDQVWVNSEWGFEWYALKAGAIPLAKQPPYPLPGDVLVSSSAAPHISLDLLPNRQLFDSISQSSHYGRIMSSPAGFYSNGYGYLPWMCGSGQIERITISEIQYTDP